MEKSSTSKRSHLTKRQKEGLKWLKETKVERDKWLEENGGYGALIGRDLNEIPWYRKRP